MTTHVVNTHDRKSRLSDLIRKAEAGDDVILARNGTPVAKIIPWPPARPARRPGTWERPSRVPRGHRRSRRSGERPLRRVGRRSRVRLLVDSHVGLWWLDDHPGLGPESRERLEVAEDVFFSVVTPWELGIRRSPWASFVMPDGLAEALTAAGFRPLSITVAHAERAPLLPPPTTIPSTACSSPKPNSRRSPSSAQTHTLRHYDVELLDARRSGRLQPRPTKGMVAAITVIDSTFASGGRVAM